MGAHAVHPGEATASRPRICQAEELQERMRIYDEILQRACALCASHGGVQPGYENEDWLQAEAEFLRPVPVEIRDLPAKFLVRANVLGFEPEELQVSIGPRQLIIGGRKESVPQQGNKLFYVDWYPNEILRTVDLPAEILPEESEVVVHGGYLEFELPKAVDWEPIEVES